MKTNRSERGQAIVLVVLAIVAMFGFAALAIDGGRIMAERRQAQNAADAAALSAALEKVEGGNWQQQGLDLAAENGYDNDGVSDSVEVYNPPISGNLAGDAQYVQVIITSQVESVFIHLIYPGPLQTTVEAVARARPASNMYANQALVGTNPHECKTIWFSGTGDTDIFGAGVFSNSDANGTPASCDSGVQGGSGRITVHDDEISTVGSFDGEECDTSTTPPEGVCPWPVNTGVPHIDIPQLPTPVCGSSPNTKVQVGNNDTVTLSPGLYKEIKQTGGSLTLNPGIYCLTGNFTSNGGTLYGKGVMIYLSSGSITLNGGSSLYLEASTDLEDSDGNQWAGMLFYMPYENKGSISVAGGSESTYIGTIFAPGPPSNSTHKCSFQGNSGSLGLYSQIICDRIEVTGTGGVEIHYDPNMNYPIPPIIDLSQ